MTDPVATADTLRAAERSRLRALVDSDLDAATPLHATDFQLITPRGRCLTREQYFDAIRDGHIRYLAWEPGPIDVRLHGDVAMIRYRGERPLPAGGRRAARIRHLAYRYLRTSRRPLAGRVVARHAHRVNPFHLSSPPRRTS